MNDLAIRYWDRSADTFAAYYDASDGRRFIRRGIDLRSERAVSLVRRGDAVLDVGCGPGRQLVAAAQRGAARVVGVEPAPRMRALAQRAIGSHAAVELRAGTIEAVEPSADFDVVWALGVFDYIDDGAALLAAMAARSRGRVAVSFRRAWALRAPLRKVRYALHGCPVHFHTRGGVQRLFAQAGLKLDTVEVLAGTLYFAVGRRS